jgi:hypothetical protein
MQIYALSDYSIRDQLNGRGTADEPRFVPALNSGQSERPFRVEWGVMSAIRLLPSNRPRSHFNDRGRSGVYAHVERLPSDRNLDTSPFVATNSGHLTFRQFRRLMLTYAFLKDEGVRA